jgi:hypothetical protein
MKKLWTILSIVGIANVIAAVGFVGWLVAGDRLNMDRVRAVRMVLAKTITQQRGEEEAARLEQEQAKARAEAEAKAAKPPLTAAELLSSRVELTELDRQRIEKLREEVRAMQAALAQRHSEVQQAQARLDADKKAFDEQVVLMASQSQDEQFRKTLGVLETLKAPQAMQMLGELMALAAPSAGADAGQNMGQNTGVQAEPAFAPAGANSARNAPDLARAGNVGAEAVVPAAAARPKGLALAVEFLNAMEDKNRTKIIADFAKGDPRMAAELLDGLRRRGQFARADGGP